MFNSQFLLPYVAAEDEADCEEELDEMLSCMSDAEDACDSLEDDCENEREDLEECFEDFCIDHPSKDTCEDLSTIELD